MSLIEVKQLTKRFKQAIKEPGLLGAIKHLYTQRYIEKWAVNGLDFTINQGEAVAYLGPNGAGKSTTIKMLSGVLVPTTGSVIVGGLNPHKQRIANAKQIGVVFGHRTQLWWDIPLIESFSLLKDIYEIPSNHYRETLEIFTELLGLSEFIYLPVRKLSLGQRMRADLAAALLHSPRILYLDEPTLGLDIAVKKNVREFIKYINREKGVTIILTTHDLGDIEDLCQRLIIIDEGQMVYDGKLDVVKDLFARDRTLHIQTGSQMSNFFSIINSLPSTELLAKSGSSLSLRFDRFQITAGELVSQIMKCADIIDFRIDEPQIEEVIKKVYSGELKLIERGMKR